MCRYLESQGKELSIRNSLSIKYLNQVMATQPLDQIKMVAIHIIHYVIHLRHPFPISVGSKSWGTNTSKWEIAIVFFLKRIFSIKTKYLSMVYNKPNIHLEHVIPPSMMYPFSKIYIYVYIWCLSLIFQTKD